jgi:hypothetical protein
MLVVGFEPTTTVFERAKTAYPLDGAATVVGLIETLSWYMPRKPEEYHDKHQSG